MTWLNAALAFAITMLILSMVTSVFVETIHRFIGLREKGLKLLVGHVYDRVIAPYLDKQGLNSAALKNEFVDLMTVNRAPAGAAGTVAADGAGTKDLSSDSPQVDKKLLSKIWDGRRLARLETTEFMSRLGGSGFGDSIRNAIQSAGLAEPEQALKGIAESFGQFGRETGIFFERRARLLSVLAALVVSFAMYVHPYELFHTYLTNPETALAVIEKGQDATKKYEDRIKAGEAPREGEVTYEELTAKMKSAMAEATTTLRDAGSPVGWTECRSLTFWQKLTFISFMQESKVKPELQNCVDEGSATQSLQTIFWLVIGGFLVGLGGPFWYDTVKSLTNIRSLLGGGKSKIETQSGAAGGAVVATAQPQTPVDHFNTGAAQRDATLALNGGDDGDDLPVG